jgi:ubiquinone/menaquinone biosynthesis C-methylase UbiE
MATQQWNPETYEKNARFVSDLGAGAIELLAPKPGERILDLGCGDGALTETLVAAGCTVVAVDASAEQVAGAVKRGLDARVARAEALPFNNEFDAVFSNAVLHWVKDADGVIASVARALKPGGRFVAEFGGFGCIETIRAALRAALARRGLDPATADPWYFPNDVDYRAKLEANAFTVRFITLFPRPTPLPGEAAAWLETFAQPFLGAVAPADRPALIAEVCDAMRPTLYSPHSGWTADYIRLRFAAERLQ